MNSDKYSVADSRSIAETSVADSCSERSKRENRKALRIFIPVMIAAALVGGLIGGFSSTGTAAGLADSIASYLDRAAYLLSPYLMIASVIVGIVGGCFCYRSARRLFTESEALTDEDAQYEALAALLADLSARLPIRWVTGHEHVAPGRKSDPGPFFDWRRLARALPRLRFDLRPQTGAK